MAGVLAACGPLPADKLEQAVLRMAASAPYRGAVSVWTAPGVVFGVQGSEAGASLAAHNGAVVVAYGYVGNWSELAQRFGVNLGRGSLAERIATLWQVVGLQGCAAMRGEYRALLWNEGSDDIAVVGDLVGARPLVTAYVDDVRVLACEPRQALAGVQLQPRLDEVGLMASIMDDEPPQGRTLFAGVTQLRGGAIWSCPLRDPAKLRQSQELPFPFDESLRRLDADEAAEELYRRLVQAVQRALPERPFAVSLSGGLDSGSIVGLVGRLVKNEALEAERCLAISLLYPGCGYDEYLFTAQTLAQAGLPAVFIDDRFNSSAAFAMKMIPHSDYLFGGTAHHIDVVAEAALTRGRRVVLNGVGGDEWLGGGEAALLEEAAAGARLWAAGTALLLQLPGPTGKRPLQVRIRQLVKCLGWGLTPGAKKRSRSRPPWFRDEAWSRYVNLVTNENTPTAGTGPWRATLVRRLSDLQGGHYFSFLSQRAAVLGVEHRHPLMDQEIIEFGVSVPGKLLLQGRRYKGLFRYALRGVLPTPVLRRVVRTVFDDHIAESMPPRSQLGNPRDWVLCNLGILDPGGVDKMLDGLYTPGESRQRALRGVGRVWRICLAEWWTRAVERKAVAALEDEQERRTKA